MPSEIYLIVEKKTEIIRDFIEGLGNIERTEISPDFKGLNVLSWGSVDDTETHYLLKATVENTEEFFNKFPASNTQGELKWPI